MLAAEETWGCRRLWGHIIALPPEAALWRMRESEQKRVSIRDFVRANTARLKNR